MADSRDQVNLTPGEKEKNSVLDEMYRRGLRKREDVLGGDYFARLRDFWAMRNSLTTASRSPTFRPQIQYSDLHWMVMQEAGDLTDNVPMPIITRDDGTRLDDHERALRGQWYVGEYNLAFYHGCLEALLCGTGVLMMLHDPYGRNGRGNTILKPIDTESFVVDDGCTSFRNWQYVCYRSRLSLDEIRRCFPERNTRRLPRFPSPAMANVPKLGSAQGESAESMRLPPGPMQQMNVGPIGTGNDLRTVEYFLFLDDGRRTIEQVDGKKSALLPEPETEPLYPNGRMIVRCDKVHLYDGPIPYKRFNFIPIQVHPNRANFWAPPPIRYVIQLQELAQMLARQNFENVVRLNNGMVVISQSAGLNADSVVGLPGERIIVNGPDGADKAIKILTPPPFSPDTMGLPDKMLAKMKQDFGRTDERSGKMPAGNVSSNLFDSSMTAAAGLTQTRGRLAQPAVKLALEMVYETMLQFQNEVMFPLPNEQSRVLQFIKWATPDPEAACAPWELLVDPASTRAMSSMMSRQYALLLRNAGLLDVKSTLQAVGWPDAEGIADKIEQDMQMQLLSKASSPGRPSKG